MRTALRRNRFFRGNGSAEGPPADPLFAYHGTTVDGDGTPTVVPSTSYGSAADRVYCLEMTSARAQSLTHLNLYHRVGTWPADVYGVVYNGVTLVGRTASLAAVPAGEWSGYVGLVAEPGQSLQISTNDVILFGIAGKFTVTNTLAAGATPNGVIRWIGGGWSGSNPPADITGYSTSSSGGLCVVLKTQY